MSDIATTVFLGLEIVILYTAGRKVSEYLSGVIISSNRTKALPLHLLFMPGVALHETSHAITALVLGGKINKYVPYSPKYDEETGVFQMGYVTYSMRNSDPVRRFLIGIAPLFGVPLLLMLIGSAAIPETTFENGFFTLVKGAISNLFITPWSLFFLYLLISGSLGLLPSASDHQDIIPFFLIVIPAIALINFALPDIDFRFMLPTIRFLVELLALPSLISVIMFGMIRIRNR